MASVTASEAGIAHAANRFGELCQACLADLRGEVPWNRVSERVTVPSVPRRLCVKAALLESSCLGLQLKVGGKFHLRLNTGGRPIANKYCEGKMKSTLERESKDLKPLRRKR